MHKYKTRFVGQCPLGGLDEYTVTIKSEKMILAEDIRDYLATYKDMEIFQEDLILLISKRFRRCPIKLKAFHTNAKVTIISKAYYD